MSEQPSPQQESGIQTPERGSYTVIAHYKQRIEMYHILRQDLDNLISGYGSIHLTLFGIAVGAALTVIITYYAVPLQEPIKTRFWAAGVISIVISVYCGIMAYRDWCRARDHIKRIKEDTEQSEVTVTTSEEWN